MVDQKLCPKCGTGMDLGEIYVRGKATCQKCGFQGLPVAETKMPIKKKAEDEIPEDRGFIGTDGLLGKFATISTGMLVIAVSQGSQPLVVVSLAGILLFGVLHLRTKKKIRGK